MHRSCLSVRWRAKRLTVRRFRRRLRVSSSVPTSSPSLSPSTGRTGVYRSRARSRRDWQRRFRSLMSTSSPSTIAAGPSSCGTCSSSATQSRVMRRRRLCGSGSSGANKGEAWERLLREQKLGALALLRNLRNMREAGVDESLVLNALREMSTARVLPFRFLAAARYAPQWEEALEQAMLKSVAVSEKLSGRTIVLVDVSGSMTAPLSRRSEMQRTDAAYGLAVLLREIGGKVAVFSFSDNLVEVPAHRGFALRDAIDASQRHNGTYLGKAVEELNRKKKYDRLIVITDEQAHDTAPAPNGKGYVI